MRVAFLTEMFFEGKVPSDHSNMRTEFAWMRALDADHHCIRNLSKVRDYDHVFIIFPKGEVFLSAVAGKLSDKKNPVSDILASDFVSELKTYNKKIHYVQEGPHWLWNDYEMLDQINFYNFLAQCDSVFAHNEYDVKYYKGLLPNKPVTSIPTLMIEDLISSVVPTTEDKVIIGGNLARWYGGFESYIVASSFELPIYAQTSHAKRDGEELMEGLTHLPRLYWKDWMIALKDFKYAVHLMPTIAAGTFSLNCAYFGIPCIGNQKVDTQRLCHPKLSVDVEDVETSMELAKKLKNDLDFYVSCKQDALENYRKFYDISVWKEKMLNALSNFA